MRRYLLGILILAAIAGLLFYLFTREKEGGNPYLKVSGNIETTEVNVGFKIPGRIVRISVQEGDWVEKGEGPCQHWMMKIFASVSNWLKPH